MSIKMKKKLNPILSSVIVLVCVSVICVGLLAVANNFLALTPEELEKRELAFLQDVLPATTYDKEYNYKATDNNANKIKAFNTDFGTSDNYVTRVFKAKGGANDGQYIIESVGKGFNGVFTVLTGYNKDATIKKTMVSEQPPAERTSFLNFNTLSEKLAGKNGDVGTGNDYKGFVGTGATVTLNGVLKAVNLSNTFYVRVIAGGAVEKPEIKNDSKTLSYINKLFTIAGGEYAGKSFTEYKSYPIRINGTKMFGAASAKITEVCLVGANFVVLKVESSGGSFGGWTIYALMTQDGAIVSVVHAATNMDISPGEYDASALASDTTLTNLFKGKTKAEIDAMGQYLAGTTGVTETNNGIKAAAYCALEKVSEAYAKIVEFDAAEE